MTFSSTDRLLLAQRQLANRPHDLETLMTYAPTANLLEVNVGAQSLSFLVLDEDGSTFAMALGDNPVLFSADEIATTRNVQLDPAKYAHEVDWDFYAIDTGAFDSEKIMIADENAQEITDFLNEHAPNSSVKPGHKEVIFWHQKRIDETLVSVGTLVKWRTGQIMFASIATHSDYRGRGVAQELVREMLSRIRSQGVSRVGLGVFAKNVSAKRAYEKVGFELINEFSSYKPL